MCICMYPLPSHSLMVGHTAELNELRCLVSDMTGKEEEIARLDFNSKPHEQCRVDTQSWAGQVVTTVIQTLLNDMVTNLLSFWG